MDPRPPSFGAGRQLISRARGIPKHAPRAGAFMAMFLAALGQPQPASAQKVRITNISDVDFGLLSNLQVDSRRSQNICLFSNSGGGAYSVAASGSGPGSTFTLSNGPNSLVYEVEWGDQSGQSNGAGLAPNAVLTGQTSSATHQFCNSGPAASASLIIVLRAGDLAQAREGSYNGSLTLLIAAE